MKGITKLKQKQAHSISITEINMYSQTAAVRLPDVRPFSCDLCWGLSGQTSLLGHLPWMILQSLYLPSHETNLQPAETEGSKEK